MIKRKIFRRPQVILDKPLANLPLKLQQVLASRGIKEQSDLDYGLKGLLPPSGLKDLDKAAEHLFAAVKDNKSILIIGDFDCDGATSSALMIKGLTALGAQTVNFLVPDRFTFGYGLSVKLVEHAATLNPDLIVTVDNGIANIDGVARANALGIPVIITDHHLAAEQLPDALAIVNPNQPECQFASKNLAGVGVAFYLLLALRSQMRAQGWFEQINNDEPNLAEFLDIVALGTIADLVLLDKNNRILVEQGLKRIRSGRACAGIMAILQVAKRDFSQCQASDIGFAVGPRLNAAGRLDDMGVGISCLLAPTIEQALPIAAQLDQLNSSRKSIESDMLEQATLDLEAYWQKQAFEVPNEEEARPLAMCLFDPSWHQGVIGILASRIKEKINRPTIVFASDDGGDNKENPSIKGSARSVKGVHIRDALALLDSQNPGLIEKFGGHAMAAGLSIKQKGFQKFAELFNDAVNTQLKGESIKDEIVTDSGLAESDFELVFAEQLRRLGPWGQGFPEPLFDDTFELVSSRRLNGDHLKMVVQMGDCCLDGIFFRCPIELQPQEGDTLHLVYKLDINEFRGKRTLQLMVEQLEIL